MTLVDCLPLSTGGTARSGLGQYASATLFPHYVVTGDRFLPCADLIVSEISFVIEDAPVVYYDFPAFGSLLGPASNVDDLLKAVRPEVAESTGPAAAIVYFAGKREIFAVETALGRVEATHNPAVAVKSPRGAELSNEILTSLSFGTACSFRDALQRAMAVVQFHEIVLGRRQELRRTEIRLVTDGPLASPLCVHRTMQSTSSIDAEKLRPAPADILLNAGIEPEAFGSVLSRWIARHGEWADARGSLVSSMTQRLYDVDRLIRSANMFDILPQAAVPRDVAITGELASARAEARRLFKALPPSPERDSVLGALGRIGRSSLKQKVRFRAQGVVDALGHRFPDLLSVLDEAVNCRNHYVHGRGSGPDYADHRDLLVFFSDSLEFAFAVSDLMEAGWDAGAWCSRPNSMTHPFGRFREGYAASLAALRAVLAAAKAD